MDPRWLRNSFIYLLILVAVIAILFTLFPPSQGSETLDLSTVLDRARQGKIEKIEVQGNTLQITGTDGAKYTSRKEEGASIFTILRDAQVPTGADGVKIAVKEPSQFGGILTVLFQFLPLIFFGAVLLFMMRQAQGSNNQAMSFGKSRARIFSGNKPTVTFTDVAGVEEAKQELQEVVEFLKFPDRFAALGARIPRGVLLVGPPGTGKTLISRAVAGEAGVPFFSISGSEFVEMFVGVGASRVSDLFDQARRNSPCIVFVDEIDAVGRQRGAGLGGSHDEREQTLNQILVEMDGFDTNTNVIVIAATNRPDVLDPALLRPGRFDRQVVLDRPDIAGRRAILEVHARGKPFEPDVNVEVIAKQTPGFSGADLANLVNEAAILAARRTKKRIGTAELSEAIDRVMAGPERKSRLITQREKEITAYHEGGHALVARLHPHADPVHKISIVARGMAGGYTLILPNEDRYFQTRSQFYALLATALGGHAAESLIFGEMSTGPGNDIERVTQIARKMVTEYGMSERLGPRTFGRKDDMVFLGRDFGETKNYSEKTAEQIDEEIRLIIDEAYGRATTILRDNRAKLDQVAQYLIAHETVEGDELERLFAAPVGMLDSLPSGAAPAQNAPKTLPAPMTLTAEAAET